MHDPIYKRLFGFPRMVRDLLRAVGDPHWLGDVDLDSLEKLSADFVGDSGQQRRGDAVWRVRFRDHWLYLLVLLEYQSTSDTRMALRNLEYTALLYRDLDRRRELGAPGTWPPVLPVVLYNGDAPWTAALEMRDLVAPVPEALSACQPSQRSLLLDERRVPVDDLPLGNLMRAVVGFEQETTEAYMRTTRAHLEAHGRPVAYYSDRYSVFRVNRRDREGEPTQFARAQRTLDVESIHAGSPQAKGRVERANRTLQDRLVKEMRLRGICGIEAGNAYLPTFVADYNGRFGVAPRNPADAHRAVLHYARELDLILCEQHARKVTRNLSISFEGRTLQVTGHGKGYRVHGAAVNGVQGVRRLGGGAARRPGASGAAARRGRGSVAGGGRQERVLAGGPREGGAAFAAGLEAGAGPHLASSVQAGGGRGGRRLTPRRSAPNRRRECTEDSSPEGDISKLL